MRDPWKKLLSNCKLNANSRPFRRTSRKGVVKIPYSAMPVEIDAQDLKDIFEKQGGRCVMLGTQLNPSDVFITNHPLAPSVDRIDNSEGYKRSNIQICSRFANLGKRSYPTQQMSEVVERIKLGLFSKKWWQIWK